MRSPTRPTAPSGLLTDEALARRVAHGDREAFALLVARHDADLRRLCIVVMRDEDAGADGAQEAWLRAWKALAGARQAPEQFRPWLRALARNVCFDALRGSGRTQAAELDELTGGAAEPEESLLVREEARLVLGDLRELPERQREAMAASLFGLSRAQVARRMGVTERQVNTLLVEGRRNLARSRAGRALSCHEVRGAIQDGRGRNRMVRSHVDGCAGCRAYQRHARGRALLARLPLPPVLWPFAERLATPAVTDLGPVAGGPAASALTAVVATVALIGAGAGAGGVASGARPSAVAGASAPAAPLAVSEPAGAQERAATQRAPEAKPGPAAGRPVPDDQRAPSAGPRDGVEPLGQGPDPPPLAAEPDDRVEASPRPSTRSPERPGDPGRPMLELAVSVGVDPPAVADLPPVVVAPLAPLTSR